MTAPSGAGSALGAWPGAGFLGKGLACSRTQQLGAIAAWRHQWLGDAECSICREGHRRRQRGAESVRARYRGCAVCSALPCSSPSAAHLLQEARAVLSVPWVCHAQKARRMIDGEFYVLLPRLLLCATFAELVNAP